MLNYAHQRIPVVNTEGLIILKLKAGGVIDVFDVQNILKIIDVEKLDKNKLHDWAKRAGVDKILKKIVFQKSL